jgi:hypothetical protein
MGSQGRRNTRPAGGVHASFFCVCLQLLEDRPHLIVIEPDGLNGWGDLVRLCQNGRIDDYCLPVRRRPALGQLTSIDLQGVGRGRSGAICCEL